MNQIFTASTTYVIPGTATDFRIFMIGGGASGNPGHSGAGGAGYILNIAYGQVSAGTSIIITIGAGGQRTGNSGSASGYNGSSTTVTIGGTTYNAAGGTVGIYSDSPGGNGSSGGGGSGNGGSGGKGGSGGSNGDAGATYGGGIGMGVVAFNTIIHTTSGVLSAGAGGAAGVSSHSGGGGAGGIITDIVAYPTAENGGSSVSGKGGIGFGAGGGSGGYNNGNYYYGGAGAPGMVYIYSPSSVYESTFTSHTFTTAGATGRTGPNLPAVRSAYSSAAWAQDTTNNWLNMAGDNGIQLWTVPKTGMYTIDAYGGGTPCGGAGGRIKGNFTLTKNSVLSIVCGQVSIAGTWTAGYWLAEGGGGGTYVCVGDRIKVNMLCVAGGGGGSTSNDSSNLRSDGTKYGGWSVSVLGDSDTGGAALGGNGSGSGGGVSGDGFLQSPQAGTQTAKCFGNASMGGYSTVYPVGVGGFGGGGNGGGNPGGGGGGFRGGDTGLGNDIGGQGGTSYILASATNTLNTAGGGGAYQPGKVIITLLSILVTAADYESTFTSHTFTNAGATGRMGPILSVVRSAYSSALWAQDTTNNWLNMSPTGIQEWTVPKTGNYTIEAYGAQGGNADTATGGLGARIKISTTLTKNHVIKILCGQQGGTASVASNYGHPAIAGGGGGGTYIYNVTTASIILIAGGGGGAAKGDLSSSYSPARYVLNGGDANVYNETSGTNGKSSMNGYTYGTGGSDGNAGTTGSGGGSSGAGWNGSGVRGTYGGDAGLSFNSGGTGGANVVYSGSLVINTEGGFGGGSGAGVHNNYESDAGGGGGYSGGGGGGQVLGIGGGGGNYMIAGSTYISSSTNTGHGSVTVTLLLTSPATLTFTKTAFYVKYLLNSTISIPATLISTNNSDSYTLAHSSGNAGIATITTAANVGTVTVKGLGTTTITSTLAATANFDAVTVTLITITVIGGGSTVTGATMTSVDLTSTDLTGSVFSSCDLTSANLYGATFNAATDLRGSTLTLLKSGRINGFTTLLPAGYKMI